MTGIRKFPQKVELFQVIPGTNVQVSVADKIFADHLRFPKANQGAQPFRVSPPPVVEKPSP